MKKGDCGVNRAYPETPLVGVGGVVIRDECVLMVRRGREPCKGSWSIPGGMLDLGETIQEAAEREILEECGIETQAGDVVGVTDLIQCDNNDAVKYHYVLIDLLAEYVRGEPKPSSDVLAARWVPFSELPSLEMSDRMRALLEELGVQQEEEPERENRS